MNKEEKPKPFRLIKSKRNNLNSKVIFSNKIINRRNKESTLSLACCFLHKNPKQYGLTL